MCMEKYICNDRIDIKKLYDDIKDMNDEEFNQFKQIVKETNAYPPEYYISFKK